MHHLTPILAAIFRSPARPAAEPLDHPCLIGAGHTLLDDLPLPAFTLTREGAVRLVGEA